MENNFLALLLTFFTLFPITFTVCPSNFPYQYQCSCYQVVSFPQRSRWNAQSECESQSSHLAFINSEEEKEALALWYPQGQTFFWIGLNGLEFEAKTWDDGSTASYTNFADHSLTFNDQVDCYRIVPYGWVDVHPDTWLDDDCSDGNSYICEYEDAGCSPQLSLSEAEQSGCPSGFDVLSGCSCYYIRPAAWRTIDDARAICESLSSHLVFIESAEEADFLMENYNANFHYWIGLNGLETETKTWDDETGVIYSNFGTIDQGAFNDYSGCYRIVPEAGDKWYDWDCAETLGFICEYNLCHTTTAATTEPDSTTHLVTTLQTTTSLTTEVTTGAESTIYTTLETTELPKETTDTTRWTTQPLATTTAKIRSSSEVSHSTRQATSVETTIATKEPVTTDSSYPKYCRSPAGPTVTEDGLTFSGIDVGIFFGFCPLGTSIRSDFYLVQNVPDQLSVVSCASKCTEVNCGAFSFQYHIGSCRIAASINTGAEREFLSIVRTFSCLHGDDFEVCL